MKFRFDLRANSSELNTFQCFHFFQPDSIPNPWGCIIGSLGNSIWGVNSVDMDTSMSPMWCMFSSPEPGLWSLWCSKFPMLTWVGMMKIWEWRPSLTFLNTRHAARHDNRVWEDNHEWKGNRGLREFPTAKKVIIVKRFNTTAMPIGLQLERNKSVWGLTYV